jgi:general secretion pathway protein N
MNVRAARLTTHVLAGLCAALLLLVVAQYAGLGRGYHWASDAEGGGGRAAVGTIDNKPVKMPPASAFAAIEAHPLFNEDRKPTPQDATAEAGDAPPPSPLNVALTGVILDERNHVRIAMLQDKTRNQPVALKVGMPLEGEQASWTLVEVKPRGAVFRSASNETTEIELETAVAPPPPAARPTSPRGAAAPPNARPGTPGSKPAAPNDGSADLARRIEERRKQMREEAERLRNGGQTAPPKK